VAAHPCGRGSDHFHPHRGYLCPQQRPTGMTGRRHFCIGHIKQNILVGSDQSGVIMLLTKACSGFRANLWSRLAPNLLSFASNYLLSS
jgi:hypothetical protein